MPYESQLAENLFTVRFIGAVAAGDLRAVIEEIARIEEAEAVAPDRLTDLSQCDMVAVESSAVNEAALIRQQKQLKNDVKSALVAVEPLQYGLARMFQSQNDNPQIEIRVFRNLEKAKSWLAE